MEWEEHLLTLDASLLAPAGAVALAALVLALVTVGLAVRWRRPRAYVFMSVTAAMAGGPALIFFAWPEDPRSAWVLFPQAAQAAALMFGAGLLATLLAVVEGVERWAEEQAPQWLLLPQAALGVAAVAMAVQAGGALRTLGPVPGLGLLGCQEVHVGLTCEPRIALSELGITQRKGLFDGTQVPTPFTAEPPARSYEDIEGWRVDAVTLTPTEPGVREVGLSASSAWMRVETVARYEAVEEAWSPEFEPLPGQVWRYQRYWLTGVGGETWLIDQETGERRHALTHEDGERHDLGDMVMGRSRRARDLQATRCKAAFLDDWDCFCVDEPLDAARALPGVVMCTDTHTGSLLGPAVLAVLTAGIVAVRPDQDVLILQASGMDDSPP